MSEPTNQFHPIPMPANYLNDDSDRVWELRELTDLALLPDDVLEQALAQLPVLLHTMRLVLAVADEDERTKLWEAREKVIRFTEDGEHSANLHQWASFGRVWRSL
ncbi:MAG: hypothetical protein AAFX78_10080 [Cyanobacteria bacterium J06638_20]